MGEIHLPWMRQPRSLPTAQEQHPILRAMDAQVLVLPSLGLRSRIANSAPTISGAWRSQPASLGVAGDGVGAGFDETGGDITGYFQFPNRTAASTAGNTFAGIFLKTATVSAGSNNFAYWFHFGSSLNVGPSATTTYNVGTQFSLYQDASQLGSSVGITIGVPYFLLASWEAKGASSAWYIKIRNLLTGKLDSNQSGTSTYSGTGTSTWQMCGGSAFGRAFPGYVYLGAMGARYLPSDLADKWLADPWQVFEPEDEGFVGGASGAYTLTAAAGTFTEAGQDAGLLATRTIAGAAGAFALAGQDAGLRSTRTITGDAATFTENGQDAGLRAARLITGDAATFTETGQDAGLRAARLITGDAGAIALTGQDATLTYTPAGAYSISADAGSFAETGQDAALLHARLMAADSGAFAFTGNDASLVYTPAGSYSMTAAAGSFALTGRDAALVYSGATGPEFDPNYVLKYAPGGFSIARPRNAWTVKS